MSTVVDWLIGIGIIIAFLTAISIPIARWQSRVKKKKIEEIFRGRESLDERTFYERHFESQGIPFFVVSKVRKILEEEFHADLSRLTAADDFKKNLSFFWEFDSMADVEIVVRLEKEFEIKISDNEADRAETVEDLIHLVWEKVRQRAA